MFSGAMVCQGLYEGVPITLTGMASCIIRPAGVPMRLLWVFAWSFCGVALAQRGFERVPGSDVNRTTITARIVLEDGGIPKQSPLIQIVGPHICSVETVFRSG